MNKKMKFKACEGFKTATDAACESRECLHSMQSCEEEKPHLWVNLLEVNEDFEDKRNAEIRFLVISVISSSQLSLHPQNQYYSPVEPLASPACG